MKDLIIFLSYDFPFSNFKGLSSCSLKRTDGFAYAGGNILFSFLAYFSISYR